MRQKVRENPADLHGTSDDLTSSPNAAAWNRLFVAAGALGSGQPLPEVLGRKRCRDHQTRKDIVRILLSRPWNDEDVAALKRLWEDGVPVRKLALRFRRSQSAIRGKAVQLGLKRPGQPARNTGRPHKEIHLS